MQSAVVLRRAAAVVCALGAFFGVGRAAEAAQSRPVPTSSSVRVTVVDEQHYPVPGATCTLRAPGAPADQAVAGVTDEHGIATLSATPGSYSIHVALDGFVPVDKDDVVLTKNTTIELTLTLAVAPVSTGVTVTASHGGDRGVTAGATIPTSRMRRSTLQRLPIDAVHVADVLPAMAGVIRSLAGDLTMKGSGEQQSALLVNGLNAVDPGTGSFRLNLPVDSVDAVEVYLHPYSAQYGQFTGGLTTVNTRGGGDHWSFELNDFLPDPRFVNRKLVGIADDTPHLNFGGPVIPGRVYLSQSAAYTIENRPVRGLSYPVNETHTESQSYFTQVDVNASTRHRETVTWGYFPQRDRFIGLDYFHPQETTPNDARRDVMVTGRDTYQLGGGVLLSSVAWRTFATDIWGQGTAEQVVSPEGDSGNYFATQHRRSARFEASEIYNFPTYHLFNLAHDLQVGADVNDVVSRLDYTARPVSIVGDDGTLLERITFGSVPTIVASNRTYAGFGQDHWTLAPNLTIDLGLRFELQRLADEGTIVAPRAGFAWSPKTGGATIIRGGVGVFDDKIPLNVVSFPLYPERTITRYAADGTVSDSMRVSQVLLAPNAGVTNNPALPVPRNITWNLQIDRRFNGWFATSANVIESATNGRYVVSPVLDPSGSSLLVLQPTGRSRYQAVEFDARFGSADHVLNVSYTRSRARGDLNDVNSSFGDFGRPIIGVNQFAQIASDAPNRVIASGVIALPGRISVAPLVEAHSGFPYSVRDVSQNFVGRRNYRRFPAYFSLDLELAKVFQVTRKYGVRLSIRGTNLTDHFNPLNVRANLADPEFGQFFASYPRRFAGGFDIMF